MRVSRIRLKNVSGGRVMVEKMVSGRLPWKKMNSMCFNMEVVFSGGMSGLAAEFLVGKKVLSMDVEVSGIRMDLAAMRVKASYGLLQNTVQVGAERDFYATCIPFRLATSTPCIRIDPFVYFTN